MLRFLLLLVAIVHGGLAAQNACHQVQDEANNLIQCGQRYCNPEEDVCVDGGCQCTTGFGQEEMNCAAEESDDFASILSDPEAFTLNKRQGGHIPVPCGYMFSRVTTKMRGYDNVHCHSTLFVHHKRVGGKQYVAGYEMHVEINDHPTARFNKHYVYKADGYGDGDQYCFNFKGSNRGGEANKQYNYNTNKNWLRVANQNYLFYVDEMTHRLKLQIPVCGIDLLFRPANEKVGVFEQTWLPGIAIKYDQLRSPSYTSPDDVVSLPLGKRIPSDRDNSEYLTNRAFVQQRDYVYEDYDNHSPQCAAVRASLSRCSAAEEKKATAKCSFALQRALFVKCYSTATESAATKKNGVNKILELYSACVDVFCGSNASADCSKMNSLLNVLPAGGACAQRLPPTSHFNDFNSCTVQRAQRNP